MTISYELKVYLILNRSTQSDLAILFVNLKKLKSYVVNDALQIVCWEQSVSELLAASTEGMANRLSVNIVPLHSGRPIGIEERDYVSAILHDPVTVFDQQL